MPRNNQLYGSRTSSLSVLFNTPLERERERERREREREKRERERKERERERREREREREERGNSISWPGNDLLHVQLSDTNS